MKLKWKTVAMVFMFLFLVQTLFIGYIYYLGSLAISNEEKCQDICLAKDSSSYLYDESGDNRCECFKNGNLISSEVLR